MESTTSIGVWNARIAATLLALVCFVAAGAVSASEDKNPPGESAAVKKPAPSPALPRLDLQPSGGLSDSPPTSTVADGGKSMFVPPNRGTPVARVGGASRSIQRLPGIEALVPLQSGLTLEAQPVLYWYLSESTELPVNFTLIDLDEEVPLVDLTMQGPFDQGVQRVRLAEHAAQLEEGRLYQWFVALIPDPEDRSSDQLAGGGIERVDSKRWLRDRLGAAPAEEVPAILAGAGVWYDALNEISERMDASPDDPAPRAQRAALFEQVGLQVVVRTE